MALNPASLIRGNLAVLWLVLVALISSVNVLAQTDFCHPEPYPSIPGQWASYGQVVEASDPFQTISGATIELRSTSLSYEQAKNVRIRDGDVPTNLIKTVVSDTTGKFEFGELPPGEYEIRAVMAGRELAAAYVLMDSPPQWVGRGLRVALSHQGKGCSRIYAAGLDDTDCGHWECGNLPPGEMKVVRTDGTPLSRTRLLFLSPQQNGSSFSRTCPHHRGGWRGEHVNGPWMLRHSGCRFWFDPSLFLASSCVRERYSEIVSGFAMISRQTTLTPLSWRNIAVTLTVGFKSRNRLGQPWHERVPLPDLLRGESINFAVFRRYLRAGLGSLTSR